MCSVCSISECGFDDAMSAYRLLFGGFEIPAYDPEVDL